MSRSPNDCRDYTRAATLPDVPPDQRKAIAWTYHSQGQEVFYGIWNDVDGCFDFCSWQVP